MSGIRVNLWGLAFGVRSEEEFWELALPLLPRDPVDLLYRLTIDRLLRRDREMVVPQ